MGTHHHKLYTVYTAPQKIYKDLATTILQWCNRRELDLPRFAELSGVAPDRLDRIFKPKPQFITVAEYSRIRSLLYNKLPLHVLQRTVAEEPTEEPQLAVEPEVRYEAPQTIVDRATAQSAWDELLRETVALSERYGLPLRAISNWAGYSDSYLSQVMGKHAKNPNPKFFEQLLNLVTGEELPQELLELATKFPEPEPEPEIVVQEELPVASEPTNAKPIWTITSHRLVEEKATVSGGTIDEALLNFRKKVGVVSTDQKVIGSDEIIHVIKGK